MKNYQAQTPQNLALTKILQKISKTSANSAVLSTTQTLFTMLYCTQTPPQYLIQQSSFFNLEAIFGNNCYYNYYYIILYYMRRYLLVK